MPIDANSGTISKIPTPDVTLLNSINSIAPTTFNGAYLRQCSTNDLIATKEVAFIVCDKLVCDIFENYISN
jgi:hypothetical protein